MNPEDSRRASGFRVLAATALALFVAACSTTGATTPSANATSTTSSVRAIAPDVLSTPTHVVATASGQVGYRELGEGSPLVLITGLGASMDSWPPSFIDVLAEHHTVVEFDNAGVGESARIRSVSITSMAQETSELISALHLEHSALLGWSMGGMIAQALALAHPSQVSRLVLAATQPGTGGSLPVPRAPAAQLASGDPAKVLEVLFPRAQAAASRAYVSAILGYHGFYLADNASKMLQNVAITQWITGDVALGHQIGDLRIPTLIADGTLDELDPTANSMLLAQTIPNAKLILYPDAGHAFLFQDASSFVPAVQNFLTLTLDQ
jgi:pimeloyl-ACP methyl ester carboxylesterase